MPSGNDTEILDFSQMTIEQLGQVLINRDVTAANVQAILDRSKQIESIPDEQKGIFIQRLSSTINYASQNEHQEIVRALFKELKKMDEQREVFVEGLSSSLQSTTRMGSKKTVQMLLEEFIGIENITDKQRGVLVVKLGDSIFEASIKGNKEIVQMLLEGFKQIQNIVDEQEEFVKDLYLPIELASQNGYQEIVVKLLIFRELFLNDQITPEQINKNQYELIAKIMEFPELKNFTTKDKAKPLEILINKELEIEKALPAEILRIKSIKEGLVSTINDATGILTAVSEIIAGYANENVSDLGIALMARESLESRYGKVAIAPLHLRLY